MCMTTPMTTDALEKQMRKDRKRRLFREKVIVTIITVSTLLVGLGLIPDLRPTLCVYVCVMRAQERPSSE